MTNDGNPNDESRSRLPGGTSLAICGLGWPHHAWMAQDCLRPRMRVRSGPAGRTYLRVTPRFNFPARRDAARRAALRRDREVCIRHMTGLASLETIAAARLRPERTPGF